QPSVRIGLRAMRRIAERLVAEVGVACLPMLARGGTGGRRRVVPGRLIAVVVRLVLLPDSGEVLLKAAGGLDRFLAFGGWPGCDLRPADCYGAGRPQRGFDACQRDVAHHVGEIAGSSPSLAGFDQRSSIRRGIVKVEVAKPPITGMHGD